MTTYYVPETYSIQALARLKARPDLTEVDSPSRANVVLIRSRTRVDRAFLDSAPNLKFIVTATSGFDHIDWRACAERGVVVTHTPDANATSTAELTMTLILAWERNLLGAVRNVRAGKWRDGLSRPRGLPGQTLGIVGLGRVGSRVATLARAFGMRAQAYDPYVDDSRFDQAGVERVGLVELLRTSEYVTLHVPLTRETKHLIDEQTIDEMLHDSILINTCRGPVVDENTLMVALDEGRLGGAAIDVIEREPPPPGHRLLSHPRLLMTPHVGAFTDAAWERASAEAVDKVEAYLDKQPVADTFPLSTPWFMGSL